MNFDRVSAGMLLDLFEQAKATPRQTLAFKTSDHIRFEAVLHAYGAGDDRHYGMHVYVHADHFDDDIRCDERETGEDWVRKALEGSGLEMEDDTYDRWSFSSVASRRFFRKGWGQESRFWDAALAELKRAQAMHACECGEALTRARVCPVCWVADSANRRDSAKPGRDSAKPECPGAPLKKARRSQRLV